jgi:P-type Ca2+ transporter type 2C
MRDSKEQIVHRNYLKVGDIIKINTGMHIPVDGIVIYGIGIQCDESSMTGESEHLTKECFHKCLAR